MTALDHLINRLYDLNRENQKNINQVVTLAFKVQRYLTSAYSIRLLRVIHYLNEISAINQKILSFNVVRTGYQFKPNTLIESIGSDALSEQFRISLLFNITLIEDEISKILKRINKNFLLTKTLYSEENKKIREIPTSDHLFKYNILDKFSIDRKVQESLYEKDILNFPLKFKELPLNQLVRLESNKYTQRNLIEELSRDSLINFEPLPKFFTKKYYSAIHPSYLLNIRDIVKYLQDAKTPSNIIIDKKSSPQIQTPKIFQNEIQKTFSNLDFPEIMLISNVVEPSFILQDVRSKYLLNRLISQREVFFKPFQEKQIDRQSNLLSLGRFVDSLHSISFFAHYLDKAVTSLVLSSVPQNLEKKPSYYELNLSRYLYHTQTHPISPDVRSPVSNLSEIIRSRVDYIFKVLTTEYGPTELSSKIYSKPMIDWLKKGIDFLKISLIQSKKYSLDLSKDIYSSQVRGEYFSLGTKKSYLFEHIKLPFEYAKFPIYFMNFVRKGSTNYLTADRFIFSSGDTIEKILPIKQSSFLETSMQSFRLNFIGSLEKIRSLPKSLYPLIYSLKEKYFGLSSTLMKEFLNVPLSVQILPTPSTLINQQPTQQLRSSINDYISRIQSSTLENTYNKSVRNIQKSFNINVRIPSLNDDFELRELKRKMEKILEEEARRYFGSYFM